MTASMKYEMIDCKCKMRMQEQPCKSKMPPPGIPPVKNALQSKAQDAARSMHHHLPLSLETNTSLIHITSSF